MPVLDDYSDDQEQSETFDETHIDDEGDGDVMLDEADDVLDVTQVDGDADEEEFDEDADVDLDEALGASGIEAEADALLGVDGERVNEIDGESNGSQGPDEVELVYSGLMPRLRPRRRRRPSRALRNAYDRPYPRPDGPPAGPGRRRPACKVGGPRRGQA
jgi:hypothetical protein